jgi:DNA-binding NarL/FixJ family response regulator
MTKLRILLADDHRVMREGLRMLVNQQEHMEVVGEADNGAAAIALAQKLNPDVVVMDISMPDLNGLKATETLKRLRPDIKVLILTRHTAAGYVRQMLQSSADGYVLKQSASEELTRAIRRVATGQNYLDPGVVEQVVGSFSGGSRGGSSATGKELSKREKEVLRLVAWGFLNKEIADHLQISIKTVESHRTNGMSKLGMTNRVDIVRYALLQGWLQDSEFDAT